MSNEFIEKYSDNPELEEIKSKYLKKYENLIKSQFIYDGIDNSFVLFLCDVIKDKEYSINTFFSINKNRVNTLLEENKKIEVYREIMDLFLTKIKKIEFGNEDL